MKRHRTHEHEYGDGMNGANLSQGACVCEDEDTTTLPRNVHDAHRAEPRNHG